MIYCRDCRYYSKGIEWDYCHAPENIYHHNYEERRALKEHGMWNKPGDINTNNDCSWFKPSWWRRLKDYFNLNKGIQKDTK
ncbi:MAG: hypothetical protein GQ553_03695 [Nitrosomonadaceae bacterium]|nr:hypothetical protein [Nitrosomonadaceae bacterium]